METQQNTEKPSLFVRIYRFVRYLIASGAATLIDLGLFNLLIKFVVPLIFPERVSIPPILDDVGVSCAAAVARVCSATVNFLLNKNFVFKLKDSDRGTVWRYAALCIAALLADSFLVGKLKVAILPDDAADWLVTLLKAGIDTVLFIFNFYIQKIWVFPQKKED